MKKLIVLFAAMMLLSMPVVASAWWSTTNNYYDIDESVNQETNVDNTNVNVNLNKNTNRNTNIQGQHQGQSQGQIQGQGQSQRNKLVNSFVIEDKRQHIGIGGPMEVPRMGTSEWNVMQGFHNIVWFGPMLRLSMEDAKNMEPDIGYLWGTKLTRKVFVKAPATTEITADGEGEIIGIITFRGNYGTKGYECEAHALKYAMKMGGKFYDVMDRGFEVSSKSWSIGMGSAGQVGGIFGNNDNKTAGGSAGTGTNYGTSKVKARPYITILVMR